MIRAAGIDDKTAFISFVRSWLALLSQGQWEKACECIDEPNCYGMTWTPQNIRHTIEQDIYDAESHFAKAHPEGVVYTDPETLGQPRETEVIEFSDGSGYTLDYDLPLNGEWSDITVVFEFLRREQAYAVVLHDIHVM